MVDPAELTRPALIRLVREIQRMAKQLKDDPNFDYELDRMFLVEFILGDYELNGNAHPEAPPIDPILRHPL